MANKENCQSNNVDLISKLPNEVLTHILSFIDTRSAVATTFLSKRWNRLWISVPNLNLLPNWYEDPSKKDRYERFIDGVLTSNNVASVRTIIFIRWNSTEIARLNSWLASIAKRDAEMISLSLGSQPYYMPDCFFDNKRLLHLFIQNFICKAPRSVRFSSLRNISFRSLHLRDDDDSFKNLISGCPVLADLYMLVIEWNPKLTLVVSSASLLALNIRVSTQLKAFHYVVVIDAPNVRNLLLTGHPTVNYKMRSASSLTNIRLRFGDAGDQALCELLKRMIHATNLTLSFRSQPPFNGSLETMPVYRNLIKMTLNITKEGHWLYAYRMLHCAPNLVKFDIIGYELDNVDPNRDWEEPNETPRCFVSSLKSVDIIFYVVKNVKRTMQMISYILKNTLVLKNMYVHICDTNKEQEDEFRRILPTLPKSSAECQVIYEDSRDLEDIMHGVIKRE